MIPITNFLAYKVVYFDIHVLLTRDAIGHKNSDDSSI